jgi:dTDP-N-acetylfucosamine:lipid II N-acetylfucosaminyltransferase
LKKILHLIIDEKISEQILDNFSAVNNLSLFVIIKNPSNKNYIRKEKYSDILSDSKIIDINTIILEHEIKAIIVHGMFVEMADILLEIKNKIPVCWIVWGFDVYNLPKIKKSIYGFLTKKYLGKKKRYLNLESIIKENKYLNYLTYRLIFKRKDSYSRVQKAMKKCKYFATYIEEDFLTFSKYYHHNLNYINFRISTIEQYLGHSQDLSISISANNILIGNSNSIENNHLEIIDFFRKNNLFVEKAGKIKYYFPLSYGDDEEYKNLINKEASLVFNEMYIPLLEFIKREEYVNLLTSCSCAIFYHFRQQGMGNIIALLALGSRVYLSSRNPAYLYLKRMGFYVFDLKTEFPVYINSKLSEKEAVFNRNLSKKIFSKDEVYSDIRNLTNLILQN